jgi:tRNA(Ile)-lysidine synthase
MGREPRHATERRRLMAPLHRALDLLHRQHADVLGDVVVLAVSGGPDSRALLESFSSWKRRALIRAHVVSVDHDTGTASMRHAADVVARARVLAFEGAVVRVRSAKLDEASLREVRRLALAGEARRIGARVVLTAHHADDEAEGVLMSILGVGGGREGAGMPLLSRFDDDDSRAPLFVARPFLRLRKSALALACTGARAFDVVSDVRDARGIGMRAALRRHALPLLAVDDGDTSARLARHAALLRENEDALLSMALTLIEDVHDKSGEVVVRIRSGPRAVVRRALKVATARVRGSEASDPRGSARALDAILDALGEAENPAARARFGRGSAQSGGLSVDDGAKRPVKQAPLAFALAGVTATLVRDALGRGEIVLSRPCR